MDPGDIKDYFGNVCQIVEKDGYTAWVQTLDGKQYLVKLSDLYPVPRESFTAAVYWDPTKIEMGCTLDTR